MTDTTYKISRMLAAADAAYMRRLALEDYLTESKAIDTEIKARQDTAGSHPEEDRRAKR